MITYNGSTLWFGILGIDIYKLITYYKPYNILPTILVCEYGIKYHRYKKLKKTIGGSRELLENKNAYNIYIYVNIDY